jgi:hypothetical protein
VELPRPPGWWNSHAADDAITGFLPQLRAIVARAYRRAGSPYGEADESSELLERWLDETRDTDLAGDLHKEIEEAWAFHLGVHFAARQVN